MLGRLILWSGSLRRVVARFRTALDKLRTEVIDSGTLNKSVPSSSDLLLAPRMAATRREVSHAWCCVSNTRIGPRV